MCRPPKSPLKVSWRFQTLGPLGDLQGTSSGRFIPAGVVGIRTSSAIGLNICAITAEIKKYKSQIKKKKRRHDKRVLLGNFKLNKIES